MKTQTIRVIIKEIKSLSSFSQDWERGLWEADMFIEEIEKRIISISQELQGLSDLTGEIKI